MSSCPETPKRIALVGMPNTGKSTVFNRLTGAAARIGNWPGVTVDLASATIALDGERVEVVDLPGIYDLHGFSEDEKVVRRFLESERLNLLVVVANAVQLDRQLALALQARTLGIPILLALNMADEARKLGVRIDSAKLSSALRLPVQLLSARHGDGFQETIASITSLLSAHREARYARFACVHADGALCRDCSLTRASRASELDPLVDAAVQTPLSLPEGWTGMLDRVLLHQWLGLPLFFLGMLAGFELVYRIGTRLQDLLSWMLDELRTAVLAPAIAGWPELARSFVLEGLYGGAGTIVTFLPVVVVFLLFIAMVQDSGYLARAAFLMDGFMARLGLDGRSFVIQLMGFGCNVPAIMSTRVMRSPALRLLTMMVIPFALCSARLQVFLFFTTAVFSRSVGPLVLFSLYLMSFAAAVCTALLWRGRYRDVEPMMLELPPYRLPTPKRLLLQAVQESKQFLKAASGFIMAGVIAVWLLTHIPPDVTAAGPGTLAGRLAGLMAPVFRPLGIDPLLSIALLFGLIAKEIVIGALAVMYRAGAGNLAGAIAGNLDCAQAYSFMLFTLIYVPCLSTIAALRQESKSWGFTLWAMGWSLGLAWTVSFAFYQATRLLR